MTKTSRHSRIESLESRIAPAAAITGLVTSGTLKLTAVSDALAFNGALVQVDFDTWNLFEQGNPTPETFNGVKNIKMALSNAADSIDIVVLDPTNRGSISINSGNGADSIDFVGSGILRGDVNIVSGGAAQISFAQETKFFGNVKTDTAGGLVSSAGLVGALSVTGAGAVQLNGQVIGTAKITGLDSGLQVSGAGFVNGDLTIIGGSGNDQVTLSSKVSGKLRFSGGDGVNSFTGTNLSVGNSLTITGGLGSDTAVLNFDSGDPFSTSIAGAVNVALGAGNNGFAINGTTRFGSTVRVSALDGNDSVSIGSPNFLTIAGATQLAVGGGNNILTLSNVILGGGVKYTGTSGVDDINITNADINGSARFTLGDGNNDVDVIVSNLDNGLYVKGGLGIDDVFMGGTTVFNRVTLLLGDGSNVYDADGSFLRGGFNYQGGLGNDILEFNPGTQYLGSVNVKGGAGANLVNAIGLIGTTSFTYTGGADSDVFNLGTVGGAFARIKVSLGDGADTANINTTEFLSLRLDGGLGTDALNAVAAAIDAGMIATAFEPAQPV